MVKRSLLYLRRKYKRSVLLFLLLFVISFSLAVGVTVWNSIGAVTKEVQDALGTSFTSGYQAISQMMPRIIKMCTIQTVMHKNGMSDLNLIMKQFSKLCRTSMG